MLSFHYYYYMSYLCKTLIITLKGCGFKIITGFTGYIHVNVNIERQGKIFFYVFVNIMYFFIIFNSAEPEKPLVMNLFNIIARKRSI